MDHAIELAHIHCDETAFAGAATASASVRLIERAMGRAHQPTPCRIEKTIGLPIHLHGHVRAQDLAQCLRLGAICAAEVISHYGARPEANLRALVA